MATVAQRSIGVRGWARSSPQPRVCRRSIVVRAQSQGDDSVSRRQAVAAAVAAAIGMKAAPADAFLGFGEEGALEAYNKETVAASVAAAGFSGAFWQADVINLSRDVALLPRDAPNKAEMSNEARAVINKWVAKYRRDDRFSGKPSFGNTYSALNALAGHINSFGPTATLPKKRLDRMIKELDDAERFLSRGR